MPADIRAFLIAGFKERAMWERDLLGETRGAFVDALMKMRRTPLRWTRAMKTDLERIVSAAIRKMGWEPGTIPPFGSLDGLPVFLDRSLARVREAIVRAGSLTESLALRVRDLITLEEPTIAVIAERARKVVGKVTTASPKRRRRTTMRPVKRAVTRRTSTAKRLRSKRKR